MYSNQLVHKIIFLMFMVQALRKPTKLQRHCWIAVVCWSLYPGGEVVSAVIICLIFPLASIVHFNYVTLPIGVKIAATFHSRTFICMPLFFVTVAN